MPTAEQRAIVRSTVPLLETGGQALTTHFYRLLLDENPGLRVFFDAAHLGSGRQPRALAGAVLAYARHIDETDRLDDLLGTIVSRHVSLQVRPEHYPVVGDCLLRSIRTVLGADVATDAVLDAWGAAYRQLAGILMRAERVAGDELAARPGGWRGERAFRVAARTPESREIVSLRLEPADGGAIVAHAPGQSIGLHLRIGGEVLRRRYSLSAAADGSGYRISVKREPGGRASNHLHDRVAVGDTLELVAPSGDFVLRPGVRPVALITGGVGITPAIAMLQAAVERPDGRPVVFIHAARNAAVHGFRDWTDAVARRHPQVSCFYCHEEYDPATAALPAPHAVGRLDADLLARWLPADRDLDAYFLGPVPFMRAVGRDLAVLGVPAAQTRCEFFGPAEQLR